MTHSLILAVEPLTLTADPISKAEMLVLDELALGKSNADIAVSLFLSKGTVRSHISNLLGKLGAETRLQAVLSAQELGIVHAPDVLSAPALIVLALLRLHPHLMEELEAAGALRRKGD